MVTRGFGLGAQELEVAGSRELETGEQAAVDLVRCRGGWHDLTLVPPKAQTSFSQGLLELFEDIEALKTQDAASPMISPLA